MKKYLLLSIAFLAASCAKTIDTVTSEGVTIDFIAEAPETKAVIDTPTEGVYPSLWSESDTTLKMSLGGAEPVDASIQISQDRKKAYFSASFKNPGAGPYTFKALSPALAYKSISGSGWDYTIPMVQTPSATTPDERAVILEATSGPYQTMPENVSMTFSHLCAYGRLSFTKLYLEGASVSSVVLTSDIPFVGDSKILTIKTSATSDIWFACNPVDMSGHTMTFTINTDAGSFIRSITMPSTAQFKAGVVAKFSVSMLGIYPVNEYRLLSNMSDLKSGDKVLIVCKSKSMVAGDISSNVMKNIACAFKDDDKTLINDVPSEAVIFTIAKNGSYWTFANPDGELLGCTEIKKLAWDLGTTDWDISVSGSGTSAATTVSSKTSSYGKLQYNPSSPRFTTYSSSQTAIQLYRKVSTEPVDPETPVKLSMSDITCTGTTVSSLTFSWNAVNGATAYMVSQDGGAYVSQNATTFQMSSLAASSSHTVTVYAVGDNVKYLNSDTKSCTATTSAQGGGESKACRGWFELPGQKDNDHNGIDDNNSDYYYSWTMRADAAKIRNFSSCYSKSMIHPVWVAAPMHSSYKGSSGRNDSYKSDPAISCVQSSQFDGYTRGHMVGSSERTVSVATNKQAFYYSNIGAQLSAGFNTGGGAWNNLESFVEGQWCSDTLYTVIGCIFETFTDKHGTTVTKKKGTNSAGSAFQVPTAYYKVLLRTKKGNTGKRVDQCTASELKAAAFILPHKGNAGHKPDAYDMYSVADVEALTGLTFFVNVPNAPKSSYSASDWGL